MSLRHRAERTAPAPEREPEPAPRPAAPARAVTSEVDAIAVAELLLDEAVRPTAAQDIVITTVQAFPTCWVVGYNTKAFVETRSIMDALAGAGPVIVNRATGRARLGTHEVPPEQQLDP